MSRRSAILAGGLAALFVAACSSTHSSRPAELQAADRAADVVATSTADSSATTSTASAPATGPAPQPTDAALPGAPASTTSPEAVHVPSTTAAPPAMAAPTTALPDGPGACIGRIPLEVRAAQVLMPAVYGDALGTAESVIDEVGVGWLILMTWPSGAEGDRLRALKNRSEIPTLLATDEEGGNVQRLRLLGEIPSPASMAASHTPAEAEQKIAQHARAVRGLGIDVVFAPVVDVGDAAPIGTRSFGSDPATVAAYGAAYARGWLSGGITPVLKHFPGHGRASADTHAAQASTPGLDELRAVDFVPYRELAGNPGVGVMVGHLAIPDVTGGLPASLSPAAIDGLLRGELGYATSLVFTDALGMGAIRATQGLSDAAVTSLAAGADVLVFTSTGDAVRIRDRVVAAVENGELAAARLDQAVGRVLLHKGVDPCQVAS